MCYQLQNVVVIKLQHSDTTAYINRYTDIVIPVFWLYLFINLWIISKTKIKTKTLLCESNVEIMWSCTLVLCVYLMQKQNMILFPSSVKWYQNLIFTRTSKWFVKSRCSLFYVWKQTLTFNQVIFKILISSVLSMRLSYSVHVHTKVKQKIDINIYL